ncbi:MAG: reprolysin-like metallopeptidase, partial [Bacteroidota bacterium]
MQKTILYFAFIFLFSYAGFGQENFWTEIGDETKVPTLRNQEPDIQPEVYKLFELDFSSLNTLLQRRLSTTEELHIAVPLPDGKLERFAIQTSSNLPPALAAKYPSILAFKGYSTEDSGATIRGSLSNWGFHGVISHQGREIYIDPFNKSTKQYHMVYYTADDLITPEMRSQFSHDHSQFETTPDIYEDIQGGSNSPFTQTRSNDVPVVLYKYQVAIAATGEYTQFWGGTKEGTLAAINVALDRVNSILIQDVAIELSLVSNNDTLIFLDAETDPFTGTNPGQLTQESPGVINQRVGFSNYDLGHVFTRNCQGDAAGVSGGVGIVCGASKARGSSCQTSATDAFYVRIICHELGHQFGGFHTWNNCPPSNDDPVNYNPLAAFEPGSGSTIMSYSGTCQDQNVVNNPDPYYHINTIEAIQNFTRGGVGETCAELVVTDNIQPTVNIPLEDGFFIPIGTPFKLTAEGMDADGDDLTYCWEQYDLDLVISSMGTPEGNDPSFRSLSPSSSPTRYLPTLNDLIANRTNRREVLPTYSRDLTFRCTVRDNDLQAGGVDWQEVKFKATDQAGPFVLTSPNESRLDLEAGSFFEVTWDVANTNVAPVNSQYVNIRLSLDAGLTYPIVLAENTLNNGSAFVTLPDTLATFARLMVEAADNIFFDINDFNFRIVPPVDTSLIVNVAPVGVPLHCQPDPLAFEIETQAINGYNGQLDLQLIGTLPEGADFSFSTDQLTP